MIGFLWNVPHPGGVLDSTDGVSFVCELPISFGWIQFCVCVMALLRGTVYTERNFLSF